MEDNGFYLLCEKLRSSGLDFVVEDLKDPAKPGKGEIETPVRLGSTIANTYKGIKNIPELPGCEKSSDKMKKAMEYWDFKTNSSLNRTRTQILEQDIPDFLKDVKYQNCDDIFLYFSGHGGKLIVVFIFLFNK